MAPKKKAAAQKRRAPGTGPDALFYRIEVRPGRDFKMFRTQDVGQKGGLERVAGKRASGSWDTQAWLISKKSAHVTSAGRLVIDDPEEREAIESAVGGPIVRLKSGIFRAKPRKNVPEKDKPTPSMQRAQKKNIKKAHPARAKKQ
ncbi:MAG TPA: hypothetical protein VGE23_02470 [Candidatus Paceibacterota bacterium]